MRVFALSDPHLSLGTPGKSMDRFGPQWVDHASRMAAAWDELVRDDDLVLVPGDISWARTDEQVAPDLAWLAQRPGTKLMGKGNHDSWWKSRSKLAAILPEGVLALDGDVVQVGPLAIAGTRLWDTPLVSYHDHIVWQGEPISAELSADQAAAAEKVFRRETARLERSLSALPGAARQRLAMVHYPPVAPGLAANPLTDLFEGSGIAHVVFGHLHSLDPGRAEQIGGEARGVRYHCASCDFIDFAPVLIWDLEELPEGG
jgi:predicted phosphohydrolase